LMKTIIMHDKSKRRLLFLMQLYKMQKWKIIIFFSISLLLTLLNVLIPLFFKYVLDNINSLSIFINFENISALILLIFFYLILLFSTNYMDGVIVSKSNFKLRQQISKKLITGDYKSLEKV